MTQRIHYDHTKRFDLTAPYEPAGDQPQAINEIITHFEQGNHLVTLMGATGTGKTFTMANIINHIQKPTLVLSHNKTLAAQLATEFKHFFPNNAVHYFISYFDYYQPESYLPAQDLYIEKEATINQEIQMYRLATLASLLTRPDVIVVASVSALYGLGHKEFFQDMSLSVETGNRYDLRDLKAQLIKMQYQPVKNKIEPWMFAVSGDVFEIYATTDAVVYKLYFNDDELEHIEIRNSLTFGLIATTKKILLRPATQYLQDSWDLQTIITMITTEMEARCAELLKQGRIVEEHRLRKKTTYDLRMIAETWFTNGIENYSPYFDGRRPWQTPNTIFDYFPDDMLCIIDESHMTIPQLDSMAAGDRARKVNLINHGFRLPSAIDHRPLLFRELQHILKRPLAYKSTHSDDRMLHVIDSQADTQRGEPIDPETNNAWIAKIWVKTLFVSATPAPYETTMSQWIVEQIIRPTWLLDPVVYVYPKSGNIDHLEKSLDPLLQKKPHLKAFL